MDATGDVQTLWSFGRHGSAASPCVRLLVIGYEFANAQKEELKRAASLKADLLRIKSTFGRFDCAVGHLIGKDRAQLFAELEDENTLRKTLHLADGNVDLLLVLVLSHGSDDGVVFTDAIDSDAGCYERFRKQDVWNRLGGHSFLKEAQQVFFMGPCRGDDKEKWFSHEAPPKTISPEVPFVFDPAPLNHVVLYASVETMRAYRSSSGTWLVQELCSEIDQLQAEVLLEVLLTSVIGSIAANCLQSPELVISPSRRFTICPPKRAQERTDPVGFYLWNDERGKQLGPGRAVIFHDDDHTAAAVQIEKCFQDLNLVVRKCDITCMIAELLKMAGYLDDEGLLLVCCLCKMEVRNKRLVLVHAGDKDASDVTEGFTSENCFKMHGRPKVFFFLDRDEKTEGSGLNPAGAVQAKFWGNNRACSLSFCAKGKGFNDALVKELRELRLRNGFSLQEALAKALEQPAPGETAQLISTMPYLVDFPHVEPTFLAPTLTRQRTDLSYQDLCWELVDVLNRDDGNAVYVLCSGPGSGKTRMTAELAKCLKSNGIAVELAKTEDYQTGPVVPARSALLLDHASPSPGDDVAGVVQDAAKHFKLVWVTLLPKEAVLFRQQVPGPLEWLEVKALCNAEAEKYLERHLKGSENWWGAWHCVENDFKWTPRLLEMLADLFKNRSEHSRFGILWHLLEQHVLTAIKQGVTNEEDFDLERGLVRAACRHALDEEQDPDELEGLDAIGLVQIDNDGVRFPQQVLRDFLVALAFFTPDRECLSDEQLVYLLNRDSRVRGFVAEGLAHDFRDSPICADVLTLNEDLWRQVRENESGQP